KEDAEYKKKKDVEYKNDIKSESVNTINCEIKKIINNIIDDEKDIHVIIFSSNRPIQQKRNQLPYIKYDYYKPGQSRYPFFPKQSQQQIPWNQSRQSDRQSRQFDRQPRQSDRQSRYYGLY